MSDADFGLKGRREPPPGPEEARAFEAAAAVRPGAISGSISLGEREKAARLAAAETGFASRDPRPVVVEPTADAAPDEDQDEMVQYRKPLKRKKHGKEPTYQFSVRARVSVVERFNRLADELRMSNPELIEHLLDAYDQGRAN